MNRFFSVGATRDRSEKGPWTIIGAEALIESEGGYSPDFTATALSDSVHLLMLNIHSEEACSIIAVQKRYTIHIVSILQNFQFKYSQLYLSIFCAIYLNCYRKSRLGIITRASPRRQQNLHPYLHRIKTYSPTQASSPSNFSVKSSFSTSSTLPTNQYGSLHQASPGGPKLDLGNIDFSSSLDSEDMENDIGIRLQDMVTERNIQNGRNLKFISNNTFKSNSINIVSNSNSNDNDSNNSADDCIDIDKNGINCTAGIAKGISLLNPFKAPYGRLPISDTDTV